MRKNLRYLTIRGRESVKTVRDIIKSEKELYSLLVAFSTFGKRTEGEYIVLHDSEKDEYPSSLLGETIDLEDMCILGITPRAWEILSGKLEDYSEIKQSAPCYRILGFLQEGNEY